MNRRIKALLMVFALVLSTALFYACGNSGEAEYQVTVVDSEGKPFTSNVIVKFMQNGAQVAMQPVDANGVAKKTMAKGDYTLEVIYTDDRPAGYVDPTTATLSADKTSVTLTLYNAVSGEGHELYVNGEATTAHYVSAGGTHVTVAKGVRNYFIFTPTQAGTYKISVSNNDLKVGYYGSPFFVQAQSIEEPVDNTVSFSVSQSMIGEGSTGTSAYVLGIDGLEADADCILFVQRTGDPAYSISDEPWTTYVTTHTPEKFTLDTDKELTYVDIKGATADNQVVFNEADGYYHFGTADGPVVYMHLGKGAPYVALQVVVQGDGPMGGAPIRNYFYDDAGNFVKKEDYTDILSKYFENMDENQKVYPLTKDLVYIIQNGCQKWWLPDSVDKMSAFDGCNTEIAWMFALCYVA